MEEKNLKYTPKPGIPEALYPDLGNGASLAVDAHSFALLSPDPTKALERLLPEIEQIIDDAKSEGADLDSNQGEDLISSAKSEVSEPVQPSGPAKAKSPIGNKKSINPEEGAEDQSNSAGSQPKPAKLRIKKSKKVVIKTIKKVRAQKTEDEPPEVIPNEARKPSNEEISAIESDIKKTPKPGKRIRKAAKAVQKQQKVKKSPAKKTAAKKAPVKKVAAKKASVGKSEVKTPVQKTVEVKKYIPRNILTLSPFTQWLKELGGGDYVHPYDDDFALSQEKGALKEVISETYANLLAVQGYKDRAIAMYLKLIEKYPEKSSFFAAKIEALQ